MKIPPPARKNIRDLSEPSELAAPVGYVAAASARNGEPGDEIREWNLRGQEGHHDGLGDVEFKCD